MHSISIRELHQSTGKIVRYAATQSTIVTDRGRPIAIIKAITEADLPGKALPPSHWQSQSRPRIKTDSTATVSTDRDR
ncbi:MAG: hypothetical protein QM496_04180 [Verrucomicrobiota bacterium]